MTSSAAIVAEADSAVVAGDLKRAEVLLVKAANGNDCDAAILLKLAALQRGTGRPQLALDTVHKALSLAPRDFTALLMRASLLDSLCGPAAPEAWSHALAQKPDGDLSPHLATVLARGQARVEQWRDRREQQMKTVMQEVEARADAEQRQRFARFRTNVLRRTRAYHSEPTAFHFPGLPEREFHPRRLFPWISALEAATDEITAELNAVMAAERAELVPYIQYDEHLPLDQWKALNHSPHWTAIHLLQDGQVIKANARHCPRTLEILRGCDQPKVRGASPNAMFSLLAPHTRIPPHVGVNNARLVCHLPLVIPEGCWFRVGGETRFWKRGEAFVFDDTIEHEALNPTDQLRIVFIFDVWHPELDEVEREGIAALIAAETSRAQSGL